MKHSRKIENSTYQTKKAQSLTSCSKIKKILKKEFSKPTFTRVTAKTIARFSDFKQEDRSNLTRTDRPISEYERLLSLKDTPLFKLISERALETGKKINLLDAGCGEAEVIDELLSDQSLNPFLNSCTGISLHYFTNTQNIMEKHHDRFKFYLGKAQDVLAKHPTYFDIIVDVFGACFYSEDRLGLLKLYHQALKPNGKAFIYFPHANHIISDTKQNLCNFLVKNYPDTFSQSWSIKKSGKKSHYPVLALTKTSQRFPVAEYEASEVKMESALSGSKKLSYQALKKGNALFPDKVRLIPATEPAKTLRSLPFRNYCVKTQLR